MAVMKNVAIELHNAFFDCPGTLTIAQLSRPARGEDAAERLVRLARKAVAEGVQVRAIDGRGRYAVSSGTTSGVIYLTDTSDQTCTCAATGAPCKHLCLCVMYELIGAPDPTGPAVVGRPAADLAAA